MRYLKGGAIKGPIGNLFYIHAEELPHTLPSLEGTIARNLSNEGCTRQELTNSVIFWLVCWKVDLCDRMYVPYPVSVVFELFCQEPCCLGKLVLPQSRLMKKVTARGNVQLFIAGERVFESFA